MSDKAEESTQKPNELKSLLKRSGQPITHLPFKKRLSLVLLSIGEEGEGSSQPEASAGASAGSSEDGVPKVKALPVWEDVPDQLPIPVKINMEIKEQLKKEIRHFGGKYEVVLKLLEGVQGAPELRRNCFLYAMKEARRFKRQDLVHQLGLALDKLECDQFLNKSDVSPSL